MEYERVANAQELAIFKEDTELDGVNWELAQAAAEVVAANERYNRAILARIALNDIIRGAVA